jgi:hypothetical protein
MLRRFLLGIMVLSFAAVAWAGIPDPANSEVDFYDVEPISIMVLPNGLGDRLDAAKPGGVDATITVTLRDAANNPVVLYSFEDLWLAFSDLYLCPGQVPTPTDGSTDENGQTFWAGSFFAGDCDQSDIFVSVGGTLLPYAITDYNINSPDLTGDGVVNISDTADYWGLFNSAGYDYCIDFDFNGLNNIADTAEFYGSLGTTCP